MARLNSYWLSVAMLWTAAIGLTIWNLSAIEEVSMARDQSERLRNELLFQRQYAAKLESVRQTAETYTLPVDSAKLGFLAVHSQLESLGAVFGLEKFQAVRQVGVATPEQWPLTVSFKGPFEAAVQFLHALEAYPYLPILQTRLKVDEDDRRTSAEIQLAFRFRLKSPADIPSIPMRTTQYPLTGEERPS